MMALIYQYMKSMCEIINQSKNTKQFQYLNCGNLDRIETDAKKKNNNFEIKVRAVYHVRGVYTASLRIQSTKR